MGNPRRRTASGGRASRVRLSRRRGCVHRCLVAANASHGDSLREQIHNRGDLRLAAVVPLQLACLCMLHDGSDRPLPVRRRELYDGLLRHLLAAGRAMSGLGADAASDLDECLALLISWAWQAVRDRTTSFGLGDWPDTFTQPTPPPAQHAGSIDHVVPKVNDVAGTITRRFLHRSLLEHLVAEYIATLGTDEAGELLLPHLWYDADWQFVVPAAVAAHNLRHPGALLARLFDHVPRDVANLDAARKVALQELDQLLLAIAAESAPDQWPPEQQRMLHKCRRRNCTDLAAMTRTAQWDASNDFVRHTMIRALAKARGLAAADLASALAALHPTERDRAAARQRLLAALLTVERPDVAKQVRALSALHPTYTERTRARGFLLGALPTANPRVVFHPNLRPDAVAALAATLSALDVTEVDQAQIRQEVLAALIDPNVGAVAGLVAELSALDATDADRAEARRLLLRALTAARPSDVGDLMAALSTLDPPEADQSEVRRDLLGALPTASPWVVARAQTAFPPIPHPWAITQLLHAVVASETPEADEAEARRVLLGALPTTVPRAFIDLMAALPALHPTYADLAVARRHLLGALQIGGFDAYRLFTSLPPMHATSADLAEARHAVLGALPSADPLTSLHLLRALPVLHPTSTDRAEARRSLLAAIQADDSYVAMLVMALLDLHPVETDRAEAQRGVLAAMHTAETWCVDGLVGALHSLVSTDTERAEARRGLLAALRADDPSTVACLAAGLPALRPDDDDRAEGRHRVLAAVTNRTADPETTGRLIAALLALVSTEADRAEARQGLIVALTDPTADPWRVASLAAALPDLHPTHLDRLHARHSLLDAFPRADEMTLADLVGVMRSLTRLDEWLTWLNGQA